MGQARGTIGRGALYVYIETISSMAFGYFLLLILSHLTSPSTIGILSLVLSLSNIFTIIISLGVPTGMQRFLGKAFADQSSADINTYVKSSLILIVSALAVSSIFLILFQSTLFPGFDLVLVLLTVGLTSSATLTLLFRSVIISSLKTKILAIAAITSSIGKTVVALGLVLLGTGALGMTVGYFLSQLISCLLLAITAYSLMRTSRKSPSRILFGIKRITLAGMVSWIPGLVITVGTNLGTVIVFGTTGSNQAGAYFIALQIFSALSTVMSALLSVAYPALSGMADGRKRLTWRIIRISLIVSLPLASALFFYSKDTMQLMGPAYGSASDSLKILLISMLPTVIFSGINTLVYSYGNYKQVLIIGLSSSLPRVALYFILVPISGSLGAAISFTIGSIIGFVAAIAISKNIGFRIDWLTLSLSFSIPMIIAYVLSFMGVQFLFGIFSTFIVSILLFSFSKILTRSDMNDFMILLPSKVVNIISVSFYSIQRRVKSNQKSREG